MHTCLIHFVCCIMCSQFCLCIKYYYDINKHGLVFQKTIGIPMGTDCAPILPDLFLHTYEADFLQWLLKKIDITLAQTLIPVLLYR